MKYIRFCFGEDEKFPIKIGDKVLLRNEKRIKMIGRVIHKDENSNEVIVNCGKRNIKYNVNEIVRVLSI